MHPKVASFLNSTKSPKRINFSEEYGLEEVPGELKDCREVEDLDLSYTSITSIPDFVFQLPKLKKLSYIGCDIKSLPKGIGLLSGRLSELSISIENFEDAEELFQLSELKSLQLQGSFESIPDDIVKLQKLEELAVVNVNLKKFPAVLSLKALKQVSLIGEIGLDDGPKLDIDQFFIEMSKSESLRVLSIENYQLKELPSTVGSLSNLEQLHLQDNLLEEIPEETFDLLKLKELDLSINSIRQIGSRIERLQNLKILNLSSNWSNTLNCDGLFSVIGRLENLESLDLSSCQSIKNIPDGLSRLGKIKSLDFDNNLISSIPDFLFEMHQLKKLRVSTNPIPKAQIEKLKERLKGVNVVG